MSPTKQQIRFTQSHDGVRLAFAVSGNRQPTVIKAATWLSHLEFDWQSPVWQHLLDAFAARATFVRYDERGCGLSDWEAQDLSFAAWVSDLDSIVETLAIERFALLGISQGAAVAIAYAVAHPDKVSHLILHGGYARGRLIRSETQHQSDEAEMMCRLAELGWGKDDVSFRQFFTSQFIPGGTPQQHQWFNEMERVSTSPFNAARFMREFNTINVRPLLTQVHCPTLVLHSQRDVRVPFSEGRLLASEIPNAQFVPIDSGNHLLLAEEPGWEQWLQAVEEFLFQNANQHQVLRDLSERQLQILRLLAQGRDNAQIAANLDLSEKTVRNQVSLIFTKLSVENRAQAIVLARELGVGID